MRFLILSGVWTIDASTASRSSTPVPSKPDVPPISPPPSLMRTGSLDSTPFNPASFRRVGSTGSLTGGLARRNVVPLTTQSPSASPPVGNDGVAQRITVEEHDGTYVFGASSPHRGMPGFQDDYQTDGVSLESPVTSASYQPPFNVRSVSTSVGGRGVAARSPDVLAFASSNGARSFLSTPGDRGTGLSILDMSPLSAMASSVRRADLIGDVRASQPVVGDLKHLLKQSSPLAVRYTEANEAVILETKKLLKLPQEVHDWVYSIVAHRYFVKLSSEESVENCFKIFRELDITTPSHSMLCLASFDSAVADEVLATDLQRVEEDIRLVCARYDEAQARECQTSASASRVRLPTVTTGGRLRSSSSAGTLMASPTADPPAHALESIVWKVNPALTAVVTLLVAASPVHSGDGTGPQHFFVPATSVLHMYTRSAAEFENLRALWFVHSRDYRRHFRAKLISSNKIFSWYEWTDFPETLVGGAARHLSSMQPDTRNAFYETEYFFPESIAKEFLFNEDVDIIAKDFLMYPHKVYFGVGPRVRCLLEALDENLSQLVHGYLAHSLGIDDGSAYHVTTRSQVEAGAFVDIVYNSPLFALSSRMPPRDFDPIPIPLADPPSKILWEDTKFLWTQFRRYWPHIPDQFGIRCLALKLILATGSDGGIAPDAPGHSDSVMDETMKLSYKFCFTNSHYADVTILPMMMYFLSTMRSIKLHHSAPIYLSEMLGNLENGKDIDRAARLKGAFGVASEQLQALFLDYPVHPPVPTWYEEHVNQRIYLADLFKGTFQGTFQTRKIPQHRELQSMLARRVDSKSTDWSKFKASETFSTYQSIDDEAVITAIRTLTWYYEVFAPTHPDTIITVILLDIFDPDLLTILYEPVDRENLARWNRFKTSNPNYANRATLPQSMKQIINVVEWYFEAYNDGFWLDYGYPWFFIANVYGQKYNEAVAGGDSVVAETLLGDIKIINSEVLSVITKSLENEFEDPDLRGYKPSASSHASECFVGAESVYKPAPPVPLDSETERNVRLIIESVLFAENVFGRIEHELQTRIEIWEFQNDSTSTLTPTPSTELSTSAPPAGSSSP